MDAENVFYVVLMIIVAILIVYLIYDGASTVKCKRCKHCERIVGDDVLCDGEECILPRYCARFERGKFKYGDDDG